MVTDERLYGKPGDEHLYWDPEDVIERFVDDVDPKDGDTMVIEERDTETNRSFFMDAGQLIERLVDETNDEPIDEGWCASAATHADDEDVVAAFEAAIQLLADKIPYKMAGKLLDMITVEFRDGAAYVRGKRVEIR